MGRAGRGQLTVFIVELFQNNRWVRVCSDNVRENGYESLREMFFSSPGIYRLVHGNRVLAIMGVG